MALTHLGLYNPPEHEDYTWENPTNYVLILDGSSPSLVPIPVHIVTASIKKRLQVVPYAHFMEKILGLHKEEGEEENKVCAVCLDCIESSHEIRVLCNCCHLFHRECLDHWVDEGQVTCPLCRSMLLPPEGNLNLLRCGGGDGGGNGGDPWMVERNVS
ncbi:brassinosteroid-responsive RING protein 1-like [Cornus florida]|uniref:brassinosteroid-responsive RING protein 1-like n=1 Tax=Cornus florida TaxID=4283 RepID=UPI00289F0AD1|nr:brassinosteroid-responsive RING protein 1-like [Cornus florida]